MTAISLDYETYSAVDITERGLDVYTADPSTEVLMLAWAYDDDEPDIWVPEEDGPMPEHLVEALTSTGIERWAFNMAFERLVTRRILKLDMPYENTRCTQVLAYMQSFFGKLDQVGQQVGLSEDKLKIADGKRLMRKFSMPQKTTAKKPLARLNSWTDPEDWEKYKLYCKGDVISERAIKKRLIKFPILESEWELYAIDQAINDAGLPMDMDFVTNAAAMAVRRQAELTAVLSELTGLSNPNSPAQLLGWIKDRGYPFDDLRKDTVKKVLTENAEQGGLEAVVLDEDMSDYESYEGGFLEGDCVQALLLRQQVARTSTRKYKAVMDRVGNDGRLRHGFQFAGASRTSRWAGRGLNPQNLPRPPKELGLSKAAEAAGVADDFHLDAVTDIIRSGDYEALEMYVKEPLNALAGTVRSSIRAPEGMELMAGDLSSIETCVIGWVSGCERLLNVFRNGLDAYKDFGQDLYGIPYAEVTGKLRQDAKPAVLGCGFRLGGGDLRDGKKTGLWGYSESLGVTMTREVAHKNVKKYREAYPEVPGLWRALEDAAMTAIRERRKVQPVIKLNGKKILVPVVFEMMKPYLTIILPSGRRLFYYKAQIQKTKMPWTDENGEPVYKDTVSYMGKQQNGNSWVRIFTHGGKWTENIVQAIARDILAAGMRRCFKDGWPLVGHVHDELINLIKKGSNYFTLERLIELMTVDMAEYPGLPLGAAGWHATFYRKD